VAHTRDWDRLGKRGPVHLMLIWDLRMNHGEMFVEVRRRKDLLSTEGVSDIDFKFSEFHSRDLSA
jgi:hypothetical protein